MEEEHLPPIQAEIHPGASEQQSVLIRSIRARYITPVIDISTDHCSESVLRIDIIPIIAYYFTMSSYCLLCKQSLSDDNTGEGANYSGKTIFAGSFILVSTKEKQPQSLH